MTSLKIPECSICNMKFTKMEVLNIHMGKFHHESDNDRIIRLTQTIQSDIDSKHVRQIFDCSECGIIFENSQEQISHNEKHHKIEMNLNVAIKSEPIEEVNSFIDDKDDENCESDTEEEGEVKGQLFKDNYYGGDNEDEILGSTIKYTKGKKRGF